jgi:hypothetical protein
MCLGSISLTGCETVVMLVPWKVMGLVELCCALLCSDFIVFG